MVSLSGPFLALYLLISIYPYLCDFINAILHGGCERLLLVVEVVVLYLTLRPPVQLADLDLLGGGGRLVVGVLIIQLAPHLKIV